LEAKRIEIEDRTWHVEKHTGCLTSTAGKVKSMASTRMETDPRVVGKLDGKDYPVTATGIQTPYTKVNDRTLTTTNKKMARSRSGAVLSPHWMAEGALSSNAT
jgi:hypothetical protein